jgi:hypothetical protein
VLPTPESLPDPRATKVDWSSNRIQVIETGNDIEIIYVSGGTACFRLIHTAVTHYSDDVFATLEYQVITTPLRWTRNMENFPVRWKLKKEEFNKLRIERTFYILRKDDARMDVSEARVIEAEAQRLAKMRDPDQENNK